MRKLLLIVVCCTATLLAGYAGHRSYKVWRQEHFMRLAREFLAKSDVPNGTLFLNKVLLSNPQLLEANRLMANLLTTERSPRAVAWRARVVELNPHSVDDRLALAQTALTMGDYVTATNALDGVDAAGKATANYQNLAGMVAAGANQRALAEQHFLEVSRLEPQNPAPQMSLAVLRLHGTNASEWAEARTVLERLAAVPTNSTLRCQALRELILDAMREKHADTALALTRQLIRETNSVFSDRIIRLEVLLQTRNAEYEPALAACERDAAENQGKVYELGAWEMAKISPAHALAWLRALPPTLQTNQPTTLMIADCYDATKDSKGLQGWLEKQHWPELEFVRHAYLCRALRAQDMAGSGKAEWEQAMASANGQKQSLVMLLKVAAQWNWVEEGEELLWSIVNRYPGEKWATEALGRALYAGGRTRSLMQLFNQELKRSPTDLAIKNNLALTALLLEANEMKPHELAREVYEKSTVKSAYAATYAYSLCVQGKSAEALKVMEQLRPEELERPSTAGYYGFILKATGNRAKARVYLDKAIKSTLLPEERRLFEQARGS